MPYNPNLISRNIRDLEYNKYTEIYNDSRFPAVTSVIASYDDNQTQTNVYNKVAELMYLVNASDIQISLSGSNFNIGAIEISDPIDHSIRATVKSLGVNDAALQTYVTNTIGVSTANTFPVSGNVAVTNVVAVSGGVYLTQTAPVSGNVAVTNVVGVSGGVYLTQTAPVSGNVTITNTLTTTTLYGPNASPFGDNASSDAFGRLRVSFPNTLLDCKFLYDKQPQYFDEVINIGASTFVQPDSLITMATSGNGGYVIRQTTTRYNYQPGKSMFAAYTFVAPPETNIVKRIGSFQGLSAAPYTPIDGTYLEIGSNGPSFNIIKTAGITNTVSVPQSAWNIDPLNGSGPSGLNLDFTKGQIYAMDYEWLGLGRLRFGFYVQGKLYYAHQVTNVNSLSAPYMTSPNQPVRYEIRQNGAGTGLMKQICATVVDESSQEVLGTAITASLSSTVTVQNGIMTPILAIRLNPDYSNIALLGKSFDLYNTDNTTDILYKVYRNPLFNRTLNWQNIENSYMQFATGGTPISLSGGYSLYSGYVPRSQGTGAGTGGVEITSLFGRFGTQINSTPDTLVVAGMGLGSTATVYSSFNAIQKA